MKNIDKIYEETVATLLNVYSQLDNHERRENSITVLFEFTAIISDMEYILLKSGTKVNQTSKNRLKKLKEIHNTFSNFYFGEVYFRVKAKKLEEKNQELGLRCSALEKENQSLKDMLEFNNQENQS